MPKLVFLALLLPFFAHADGYTSRYRCVEQGSWEGVNAQDLFVNNATTVHFGPFGGSEYNLETGSDATLDGVPARLFTNGWGATILIEAGMLGGSAGGKIRTNVTGDSGDSGTSYSCRAED